MSNDRRVLLAGRVSGAPAPIPGVAGSFVGAVNVISRGVKFNTWTVVLGPDLRLPRPLRHGDAVALIGECDPCAHSDGETFGPIAAVALLALDSDGEILRDHEAAP